MIAGTGADQIVGNADEDILIAGTTAYDAKSAALCAIMAERTSASSYAYRVAQIMGSAGGMNGVYVLKGDDGAGQIVFNDNDVDTLTGSAGQDWFFANLAGDNGGVLDKVTDQAINELFSDSDC